EEVVKYIKEMSPLEYQCLCKELFTRQDNLQASPAISQKAILSLKISDSAKPGIYELRLISRTGISNPLSFEISNISEEAEDYYYHERKGKKEISIKDFPIFINGEIMPGEVDYFPFSAEKGERIRFSLKGRILNPYIGDAVPGWFQPVIAIYNEENKIIAFADDYYRSPDPILDFIIQNTGQYKVSIRDSIYRGREDFVYRLRIEKLNSVSSEENKPTEIPERFKTLKIEQSNASSKDNPQVIECPSLISGVFNDTAKPHYFLVNFTKGKKIVLESFAARLNAPTDTFIQVFDTDGNLVISNDDHKNLNIGYITHHSDSYCILDPKYTGKYLIKIGELQDKFGADYKYFLRVDHLRPDFIVYHYPSALNVVPGHSVNVNFMIERFDNFDGNVEIKLKSLLNGISLSKTTIKSSENHTELELAIQSNLPGGIHDIEFIASAEIAGRKVEKRVLPSDEVMQAFIYKHLLPASNSILCITGRGLFQKQKEKKKEFFKEKKEK
ncbi:MAG TPA: hypothetical protein P5239_12005, partial [Victivallales bacterium]|nr:hypothetical protein [Victivallales bacterium]